MAGMSSRSTWRASASPSDVEIPDYQPFYLHTLAELRAEIARLGLAIPVEENVEALARPLTIGGRRIANRFCAQPITGCDGTPDGAPGRLTRRRYERYASGGFGLIWVESTTAGTGGDAKRLRLNEDTLEAFRSMVAAVRAAAADDPAMILQLTSASRGGSEEEIERSRDELVRAATLAAQAGFDGVDVQADHRTLAGTLLRAFARSDRFGGTFENRSRFLLETLPAIRAANPRLLLAVRLSACDCARGGFGVSASDYRKPDLTEPIRLVQLLNSAGGVLLNVTASSPNLQAPLAERASKPHTDADLPDEHPLTALDRQLRIARALREAAPGLAVVGSGFSWLRAFVPQVAAAAIGDGAIDFAGLGRGALADPDAASAVLARGRMDPGASCIVCFACSALRASGEPVGCVIRDSSTYGGIYREMRQFDADQLLAGARRCHQCEAAPCIAASPTQVDIPAFIAAFLRGDEPSAYEIIRARDPLPELTSQLSPAWLQGEGACIETALTGTPVPILDLQYAISWRARERGQTGVRIPERATGRRIAIIGAGPAGIAAAIRLIERGHSVALLEASDRLGGAPERVIPASRAADLRGEIDAALRPAIAAGRLEIRFGSVLGENLALDRLLAAHDAVLVATGLWQERSLGKAEGVVGALDFLESARRDAASGVPARVIILAGGDSAMDAARTAQDRGAREIFIIFGGPRSAMHWHMPESWFATPGVEAMMNWQPLGYDLGADGRSCGVRLRHMELGVESVLAGRFIIEAMGLEVSSRLRNVLAALECSTDGCVRVDAAHLTSAGRVYAAGALVNGGASVADCVAEGLAAAEAIDGDLRESGGSGNAGE